ncbi:MAG: hypothetical protein CVT60_02500 [Actinobacteria bacterium HGW-Actinobacteria-10]|nr:MAG: hypothetical protein CVT60_02500 [Actinobacteria bacterium HGW-Actinobacteria-10]
MSTALVLDASVGVKWFRDEPGSAEARHLLRDHGEGRISLIAPSIFQFEVLDVARRHFGVAGARAVWDSISRDGIALLGVDPELTARIFDICERLGCTTYDAAAPALAEYLNCGLVSADRRAHGGFDGVRLIGE